MAHRCLPLLVLALASCQKPASTPAVFLLPAAYNLTGDAGLDWIARALPALIEESLDRVPGVRVHRLDRYQEAIGHGAGALIECRYELAPANQLQIRCWCNGSEATLRVDTPVAGSWSGVAAALARQLDARAGDVADVPVASLQAFGEGRFLDAAVAGPAFSAAYSDGVAAAAARGDLAQVQRLLEVARPHAAQLRPSVAARLDLARATIAGDTAGQVAALTRLDSLAAPDPVRLAQLSTLLISQRRIPEAVAIQERLTGLAPGNADAWNQLGYYRAANQDLPGAKAALEEYRKLAPDSPNPLDSIGEIHYLAGDFAVAERYFRDSFAKDTSFGGGQAIVKAAFAQRARGDRNGAQATIAKFAEGRADGALLLAQWQYCGGDHPGAMAALDSALRTVGREAAPTIAIQLALWRFMDGDLQAAAALLDRARAAPSGGQLRLNALFTSFLTQPDAPASAWRERAEKALPGQHLDEVRVVLVSLALVARGRGAEATAELERRLARTSPLNDGRIRILLAESLRQSSRFKEIRPLLAIYPVPVLVSTDGFASILLDLERKVREQLPRGG